MKVCSHVQIHLYMYQQAFVKKRYYRFNSSIEYMDTAKQEGLTFNKPLFVQESAIFSN